MGLQEIHYATLSAEYADALGVTDGLDVELMGFVTHPPGTESGSFGLTRFYISCCAADAVPFTVVVRPTTDQAFADDTWLSIQGTLAREGDGFILEPARIDPVEEPSAPYLY